MSTAKFGPVCNPPNRPNPFAIKAMKNPPHAALSLILSILVFLAAMMPAQAQDQAPRVTARQHKQQSHIERGVRAGQVSAEEARSLKGQQEAIALRRRNMEADGKLSKTERKLLRYEQKSASNAIRRARTDDAAGSGVKRP